MSYFRNMGAYIKNELLKQGKDIHDFSIESGYSVKDAGKIFDGRLILSPKQINHIASVIGVSLDKMISCGDSNAVECMGSFSDEKNKEMLLDYIDRYIDLKEAL